MLLATTAESSPRAVVQCPRRVWVIRYRNGMSALRPLSPCYRLKNGHCGMSQTCTTADEAHHWIFPQRSSSGSPRASFCEREVLYGRGRRAAARPRPIRCRVNRPLQPYFSFLNRWMDSLVLCFWHRLDQQRERLAEARSGVRFAPIVPETHDDEIVRGNNQRGLPASARHVIGIARDWILPVAVEPEKSSIDRPIVRGPSGRKRADECGVALWENALTVPNAPLKKEIAKPRPIAPGAHLITLP